MQNFLERHQIIIYLITIIIAAIMGSMINHLQGTISILHIALGILMYGMFLQIPFLQLKEAWNNPRFTVVLVISNFIVVPLVVALLIQFLPQQSTILFGVLLVLLTPCIDYVIVFTQIGKGNEKLILISTPLLLLVQMLLLPLYITLFLGQEFLATIDFMPFIEALVTLIIIPFAFAIFVQKGRDKLPAIQSINNFSNWIPVPLMMIVLFIIISSQIGLVTANFNLISQIIPIYIAFMVLMFIASFYLGKLFKLDIKAKRALIYSSSTRNSLVVLPFALALPTESAMIAASVIVTQTIVELLGELVYLQITPKLKD